MKREMKFDEFDSILVDLIQQDYHMKFTSDAETLLQQPGIYEILSEQYNNAVMMESESRQEDDD